MADRKLSGRQIMELFYVEQESDAGAAEGDVPTVFRCKCGKTRSQRLKHGYSNLVQHVRMKHSDWVEAATLEAHPGAAPAIANQVKSSPPKRNGKAKAAWLGREQGEANGVEDETIAESSDDGSHGGDACTGVGSEEALRLFVVGRLLYERRVPQRHALERLVDCCSCTRRRGKAEGCVVAARRSVDASWSLVRSFRAVVGGIHM